jgi:hypothetical protein
MSQDARSGMKTEMNMTLKRGSRMDLGIDESLRYRDGLDPLIVMRPSSIVMTADGHGSGEARTGFTSVYKH